MLSSIEQDEKKDSVLFDFNCISTVIKAAIDVCQLKASKKGNEIHIEGDKNEKLFINGYLFEQAIINLIDNAIKYSEPKSIIFIEAVIENSEIIIFVKDQGCGIEAKHIPRLFERFYRVDKARSREVGGTGLGLAIVKHIALAHGGRVSVNSIPGEGSAFGIHIPKSE